MPKVACFHDGECPICNIEINAMKKLDKARKINCVDITNDCGNQTDPCRKLSDYRLWIGRSSKIHQISC
jgi:predicted DCC family thiol-disulfide oxidoreductase YuxK